MRSKKSDRIALQKMLRACGMCIIQIGELVARLNEDFVKNYPDIPWRQIKGM